MNLPKTKLEVMGQVFEIDLPRDTFVTMESLIDAIAGQSALLCYYGELKNLASYNARLIKAECEKITSKVRQEIKGASIGLKKVTIEEANDVLNTDRQFLEAKQKVIDAEYLEERATTWYYSIKERGQMLNALAAAYRAEIALSNR